MYKLYKPNEWYFILFNVKTLYGNFILANQDLFVQSVFGRLLFMNEAGAAA